MEGGEGGEDRARSGRCRITLLDQMSAIADGRNLSGLTLDDILRSRKQTVPPPPQPEPPIQSGRTLLDIIRDEDPKASSCNEFVGNRDRKSWRSFKDRLRLKRTDSGAAWTSSVPIPASDILSPRIRSQLSRRGSVINSAESAHNTTHHDDASSQPGFRPQISLSRRSSCRFGPNASFASDPTQNDGNSDNTNDNNHASPLSQAPTLRHQISRRHSTLYSPVIEDSVTDPTEPPQPRREGSRRLSAVLAEERSLSAREAVAAQEAAEAAAAAAAATYEAESTAEAPAAAAPEAEAGQQPVRMSLMDLLEETDRQMGFVGSRYMIGDDDEEDYEEEEEEGEDAIGGGGGGGGGGAGGVEQNCCVCMVRHKGAAFIPCGHTFCRLCSRELWVSRGNCPLCNGFILEILDIF